MIQDIRLHGQVDSNIEYYATIAGKEIKNLFFFEQQIQENIKSLRLFSPSNELIINDQRLYYKGNGGSFCEYMFGVNLPLKDMIRKEVINRLVLNGTHFEKESERLVFTNQTQGSERLVEMFRNGNAICNYYFFIQLHQAIAPRTQQELLLKALGKMIKRSIHIVEQDDLALINEFFSYLKTDDVTIYLIKFVQRKNQEYYQLFKEFYSEKKLITPQEQATLDELARLNQIEKYQQERTKIDVIYKHPDNKRLIDEYKDILVEISSTPEISQSKLAILNRLRTLSVRNNIPLELFIALDELFLKGKSIVATQEPSYLATTREILEGLFLKGQNVNTLISNEDLILLIKAKQSSLEKRDYSFDGLLLDMGRLCDEHSVNSNNPDIMERFGYIITFFDRYDSTYNFLNQLVFMEGISITEKMLRTIYGNKKVFDSLDVKIFKEIFIDTILKDKYLTSYGKKKIYLVFNGIKEVEHGNLGLIDIVRQIDAINQDALLYKTVHFHLKRMMKSFYIEIKSATELENIRVDLSKELLNKGLIKSDISPALFEKIIVDIRKEATYIFEILPIVLSVKSGNQRESFLRESALDRYYVEELEREYFETKGLDEKLLERIQKTSE
ncbi:MAG: TIGR04442 family protein [Nitrospirae bacterium]|nr:TIGR04442 family protein [Nitrospirota bacterium]MBI3594656.1 TIGR04442 family protein [Nitrospirota bacterium]